MLREFQEEIKKLKNQLENAAGGVELEGDETVEVMEEIEEVRYT
jgi:hypothetical protein